MTWDWEGGRGWEWERGSPKQCPSQSQSQFLVPIPIPGAHPNPWCPSQSQSQLLVPIPTPGAHPNPQCPSQPHNHFFFSVDLAPRLAHNNEAARKRRCHVSLACLKGLLVWVHSILGSFKRLLLFYFFPFSFFFF